MIHIDRVSFHQRELIVSMVERLLIELGEQAPASEEVDKQKVIRDLWNNQERVYPFLAFQNSEPIGLMILLEAFAFHAGGCYGVIDEMYVVPEHRSEGVGKKLIESARELAKYKKWSRIETAPTGKAWESTAKFYERQGFQFTGPNLRFFL